MCLIAFSWREHRRYELALIANRDEFHVRESAAAAYWQEAPHVFGGRDLECGGAWMLYSRRRRFAAVTNVRLPQPVAGRPRSRGQLVAEFAAGTQSPREFSALLQPQASQYGPFNLLMWDGEHLCHAGNHPDFALRAVEPGLHTLSNASLDVPWPKTRHAAAALSRWLDSPEAGAEAPDVAPLLQALAHAEPAPDTELPDTGVGLERERMLSPPFIRGTQYGTRASMVLLVDADGAWFAETRFGAGGEPLGSVVERV